MSTGAGGLAPVGSVGAVLSQRLACVHGPPGACGRCANAVLHNNGGPYPRHPPPGVSPPIRDVKPPEKRVNPLLHPTVCV
eukprot:9494604-Pyramimonas_sp.AAC.1